VLFSQDPVVSFINRYFEPAWESVRPVPIVRIDFGNGQVITRTLHGNIATYACTAEGEVLDILPGIYTANAYVDRLYQFRLLANYADQEGKANRARRLAAYHAQQALALKNHQAPPRFVNMDMSKMAIENRIKAVLVAGHQAKELPEVPGDPSTRRLNSSADVANWKELVEDTRINETIRRQQIHEMLNRVQVGCPPRVPTPEVVLPEAIKHRLYREVLHADLDDPYLGLGKVLFAGYPFKDKAS
jgi:hypothetical protein